MGVQSLLLLQASPVLFIHDWQILCLSDKKGQCVEAQVVCFYRDPGSVASFPCHVGHVLSLVEVCTASDIVKVALLQDT